MMLNFGSINSFGIEGEHPKWLLYITIDRIGRLTLHPDDRAIWLHSARKRVGAYVGSF